MILLSHQFSCPSFILYTYNVFCFQIILFVYDITNHSSFENLEDWYSTVESCLLKSDSPTPKLAVVGNKSECVRFQWQPPDSLVIMYLRALSLLSKVDVEM